MLMIRMFGGFEFCVNGHGIDGLQGDRAKSILGRLLLCSGNSLQRAPLADELWPESTEKQARTNLRRELHTLRNRHRIFHECICSDSLSITWKSPTNFEFDVDSFNSGYEGFKNDTNNSSRQKSGEHLLGLPNGVLLPGQYGEWIEKQRTLIDSRWLYVAEELFSEYKKHNAIQDAMRVAREITYRFPYKESAYLQIMQMHLLQGDKAMALQTYHQCATVLQADVGAEPSSELKSLYNRASKNAGLKRKMNSVDENDVAHLGINCFTGREAELKSITLLAQQTSGLYGSTMVLINGVAGIGKTALIHEWIEKNRKQFNYYAKSRCYEARGTYPLSPIRSWLQNKNSEQLLASLSAVDSSLIKSSSLFNGDSVGATKVDEETSPVTRERLFDALAAVLKSKADDEEGIAAKRLFFLDDLQWCDEDTLGFLDHLFTYEGQSEILLLATMRSEAITPGSEVEAFCRKLMSRGQLQQLALGNLSQDESTQLINALQKNHKVSEYLNADELCIRAGGHPLFLLEMARSEFEKRAQGEDILEPDRYALPPRVEAVIQQRISQLSAHAALIAAYASVIGTEFSFQLLELIPDVTQESLIGAMDELCIPVRRIASVP